MRPDAYNGAVSGEHIHIARPLADACASDLSRDREGAVFAAFEAVIAKRCTKLTGEG